MQTEFPRAFRERYADVLADGARAAVAQRLARFLCDEHSRTSPESYDAIGRVLELKPDATLQGMLDIGDFDACMSYLLPKLIRG